MQGTVMGGQQPVSGAQVRLYVAGQTGNASAATNLMGTGTGSSATFTTTASDGTFSINTDYTCPAATSGYVPQVYLVATGGNPGLSGSGTASNPALVMVDALGPCGNLSASTKVTINEITTVAAAWALAGFATSETNIGSTSTNGAGLANAFMNAQLIADPATGVTPGSSLPSTNTLEIGKINALADVIASCVNSDEGNPTSRPTACVNLYRASGLCTNDCNLGTFQAALQIVKNPAQNVPAIFGLIPANQPYATNLALAPHDWTLSMTVTGGGLNSPTELAIDTAGNVWVANYYSADHSSGTVSAFNPQGTAYTGANGFGYQSLGTEIYGLAVDSRNNVWAAIEEAPGGSGSIAGLNGISSGNTLGSLITIQTSNYIYFPESLATGINGNVIIGNYGDSTTSVFNYTPQNGFAFTSLVNAGYPYSSQPTDVAGDANGGVWLADEGAYTVTHIDANGYLLSHPSCCFAANGVATDKLGNAWVSNYYGNSVSEIGPGCDGNANPHASCYNNQTNVVLIGANSTCGNSNAAAGSCGDTNGGLASPAKVIVDAAQNVWVVNYHGQSITELAGSSASTPGAGISPSTTYNTDGTVNVQGGYGLDANLLEPFDLAADASGNIWVANEANNDLVMFFGIAAPTATPRLPTPVTP
jgi:streptogramin lyase